MKCSPFGCPTILSIDFINHLFSILNSHTLLSNYQTITMLPLALDLKKCSPQFFPPHSSRPSLPCSVLPVDQSLLIQSPISQLYLSLCPARYHHLASP